MIDQRVHETVCDIEYFAHSLPACFFCDVVNANDGSAWRVSGFINTIAFEMVRVTDNSAGFLVQESAEYELGY